jgi:hypothetical protein
MSCLNARFTAQLSLYLELVGNINRIASDVKSYWIGSSSSVHLARRVRVPAVQPANAAGFFRPLTLDAVYEPEAGARSRSIATFVC